MWHAEEHDAREESPTARKQPWKAGCRERRGRVIPYAVCRLVFQVTRAVEGDKVQVVQ